jgi:hypothetical protein
MWGQEHDLAGIDHKDLCSLEGNPTGAPKLDGLLMEPLVRTGGENSIRAQMIHSQVCAVSHPHHAHLVYRYTGGPFEAGL